MSEAEDSARLTVYTKFRTSSYVLSLTTYLVSTCSTQEMLIYCLPGKNQFAKTKPRYKSGTYASDLIRCILQLTGSGNAVQSGYPAGLWRPSMARSEAPNESALPSRTPAINKR
ncbi:hypothetical protein [Mariprofundus erugo]|uniref:hypothetical protein n=1 Tax=Mariprofundus erugo TaxID=2528639 RepID=UPI0010FD4A26|nr:hypothetical protein [Mariprofundus erugo]